MRVPPSLVLAAALAAGCAAPAVEVEPAPRDRLVLDIYDLGDLADGARGERRTLVGIADRVRTEVDPEAWSHGGGSIEVREPGCLVVRAPESTHGKVRAWLASLREGAAAR